MAVTSLYSGIGSLGGKVGSINTPKTLQNIETTSKRFIAKSLYEGVPSIYDTRQIDPLEKNPIVLAKLDDSKQINSVLDIIFNEAALQKNYKSAGLKARFMATKDMLQQQYINPMLQGQWGVVGLNTLTNLGESLDVFGNVVKSLTVPLLNNSADQVDYEYAEAALSAVATDNVHTNTAPDGSKTYQALIDGNLTSFTSKDLEFYERIVNSGRTVNYANLSTSERLKASIGIGEHGRINFEYATGNTFANIVMEIISDPDTWLTFGTSSLGKSAANNVVDSVGDIARQLDNVLMEGVTDGAQRLIIGRQIQQFTENLTNRGMVQEATETLMAKATALAKNADQKAWIEAFLGPVIKTGKVSDTYAVKTLADAITVTMQSKGLLSGMDAVTARQMSDILQRSVNTSVNRVTLKALRTVDTLNRGADAINRALAVAALSPSGVYPVYRVVKEVSPAVGRWITQQFTNASAINNNQMGDRSLVSFFDGQSNFQRTNQAVKDMLFSDADLRKLYKEPEYINFFYNRMGQDQVVLSEIIERFADAPLEATEALQNYMAAAHNGASFGRLLDSAYKARRQLTAGGGKGDAVLTEYIKYLEDVQRNYLPTKKQLDVLTKVGRIERTMTLHDNTMVELQDTFAAKWQLNYESFLDDVQHMVINDDVESINFFLMRRDMFIETTQKEFSQHIDTLGATLRENLASLYKISDDVTVATHDTIGTIFERLEELHTTYSVRLNQLYNLYEVPAIVRALNEGAPNAYWLVNQSMERLDDALKNYQDLFYKPMRAAMSERTSLQALSTKVSNSGNTYDEIKQVLDKAKKYHKTASDEIVTAPPSALDAVPIIKNTPQYEAVAKQLIAEGKEVTPRNIAADYLEELKNLIPEELEVWLDTAVDDAGYAESWWFAQDYIKQAIATDSPVAFAGRQGLDENGLPYVILDRTQQDAAPSLLQKADLAQFDFILNEVLNPNGGRVGGQFLDANETWLTLKFEQTHAYLSLVNDPNITKAMSMIKSDPMLREAMQGTEILNMADQFYINKGLLQTVMQAPMSDQTKQGVIAAVQRLYKVSPDRMAADIDYYLDNIVKNAQDYIVNTKQANQSLSLDYIKATRKADYDAFRELIGVGEAGASHTADEDIFMNLFVFYDLAERGDETAKALIENKVRLVSWDLETQNAQNYMNNTVHQGAIAVLDNGTVTQRHIAGLSGATISDGLMPSPGYIENKLGMSSAEYLATRAGTIDTERDLILDQLQQLYNAVSDTYDAQANRYHSAIVTQNGVAFDFELLKGKIKQYNLTEEMVARKIDPEFLDHCIIYDTLLYNQNMLGRFTIAGADKDSLRVILQNYVDDMLNAKADKLFSAPSISSILHAADTLKNKEEYSELVAQLKNALESYSSLGEANKALRRDPVARSLMLNTVDAQGIETMAPEIKDLWLRYYRSQMSEEAFARAFGDGSNLSPSVLLGANNEFQSLAYRYRYDKDLVDNFFIRDKALLSPLEAAQRQGVSKVLQRNADKVLFPDLYVPYHAEMKETIAKLLQDPRFDYMRSLRLDSNNIQQDYAILRYLVQRSDDGALAAVSPEIRSFVRTPMDWMDLRGVNKYAKAFEEGRIMSQALQYGEQTNALLHLRKDIDQFETFLDREDMWDAATQLRLRTVQNATEMMGAASRLASPEIVGRDNARAFRNRITAATRELKLKNAYDFLQSDADRTVHWLSESGGFALVRTESAEELAQALAKYDTAEYAGRNIRATVFGDHGWVWLDSNAKHSAYMDPETGKFLFSVNGDTLPRMEWKSFDPALDLIPQGLEESVDAKVFNEMFAATQQQLEFITEGATGNSVLDGFYVNDPQSDLLSQLYEAMPPEMRASFPDEDYLRRSEFWQGSHFNHTVLGVDVTLVNNYNTDIVSSLGAAMERSVKNLSTAQVYTAALLDQTGGIAQTAIAQAYQEAPAEVFEYFSKHPEIVLVVPEASDKSKFGVRVAEVVVKRPADLQYAFDNNARIMTSTVYNKLYEVLNDNIYSDTALEAWQSIMRTYKVGYLTTPGTWARNGYDAFIKNMLSAEAGPGTMATAYKAVVQDMSTYSDIVEQLTKLDIKISNFVRSSDDSVEMAQAFFEGYTNMTYDRFMHIHKFMSTSASGGEAAVYSKLHRVQQQDYLQSLLANGGITAEAAAQLQSKQEFQYFISQVLNPMGFVERVSRLAEYDVLTQKGFNKTKAIDIVEKTHFSYDTKSPIEQTMELIIPFYTFMSRNFAFWADMVERKPTYLALMRDVLEPMWDMEQYDPEELVNNNGLNYQVMSGNIPLGDTDYYLNTSFSFMDSLTLLTDTANSLKSSVFSPVQSVLNAGLQELTNGLYLNGEDAVSNWMQNTFGMKPTEQQIRDKYGDWADTYIELWGHKVAGQNALTDAQYLLNVLTFVPLIGATVSRFIKTGIYYDDESFLGGLAYLTSLGTRTRQWDSYADYKSPVLKRELARQKINSLLQDSGQAQEVWAGILQQFGVDPATSLYSLDGQLLDQLWATFRDSYQRINSQLYDLLQSDDAQVWMYTRLKAAMGYSGVTMKDLPAEVREAILAITQGETPLVDITPTIQDGDTIRTMWDMLSIKFDVSDDFDQIPTETLNEMYFEVARGAVALTNIMSMLSEDESTRYSYAVAKNKLGLDGLKLSYLPADALELIEHAMVTKYYGVGRKSSSSKALGQKPRAGGTTSRRRVYHKDTHVAAAGTGLYSTKKAVHANYGHRKAQHQFGDIVKKHYTKTGTRRMQLRMLGITPENMKHRVKDLFYYYK